MPYIFGFFMLAYFIFLIVSVIQDKLSKKEPSILEGHRYQPPAKKDKYEKAMDELLSRESFYGPPNDVPFIEFAEWRDKNPTAPFEQFESQESKRRREQAERERLEKKLDENIRLQKEILEKMKQEEQKKALEEYRKNHPFI